MCIYSIYNYFKHLINNAAENQSSLIDIRLVNEYEVTKYHVIVCLYLCTGKHTFHGLTISIVH